MKTFEEMADDEWDSVSVEISEKTYYLFNLISDQSDPYFILKLVLNSLRADKESILKYIKKELKSSSISQEEFDAFSNILFTEET